MTFVGTTSGCKIKAHPKCHGHVWDIKYYDIVMHDVQLPINLDQYLPRQAFNFSWSSCHLIHRRLWSRYYGIHPEKMKHPPANYVLMEQISYRNITSFGGGDKHKNVVGFGCASDLNGKNNCDVTLTDVAFKGLGSDGMKTGMHCGGVIRHDIAAIWVAFFSRWQRYRCHLGCILLSRCQRYYRCPQDGWRCRTSRAGWSCSSAR